MDKLFSKNEYLLRRINVSNNICNHVPAIAGTFFISKDYMKFRSACLFIVLVCIISCLDKQKPTGKDLMPEMLQTDSVQIIYFKSPDQPRYFTYIAVNDRSFINALIKDVTDETQIENPCIKEGKIYCYKNGEIFNTIFFAYLDNNCTFLRYIKNGNLYYFKMSDEVKNQLQQYKPRAVEPPSVDSQ